MAMFIRETLKYGNIRKDIEVQVSEQSIYCPICGDYHDGIVDEAGDVTEWITDCDIDDYIETYEHDKEVDELNDIIKDLEDELGDLRRQLRDAK